MSNSDPYQQPPQSGGAPPPPPGYGAPPGQGAPPPGQAPPPGYGYGQPGGVVPPSLDGVFYKPGINMLLYAITCGIWGAVWSYRTHEDLQKYNRDGLGGTVGLVLGIFVQVAIMFTVPSEIEKMYQRAGMQSPVKTIEGLWFLLPIIGMFIWYPKMQKALNDFWMMQGSRPAA